MYPISDTPISIIHWSNHFCMDEYLHFYHHHFKIILLLVICYLYNSIIYTCIYIYMNYPHKIPCSIQNNLAGSWKSWSPVLLASGPVSSSLSDPKRTVSGPMTWTGDGICPKSHENPMKNGKVQVVIFSCSQIFKWRLLEILLWNPMEPHQ